MNGRIVAAASFFFLALLFLPAHAISSEQAKATASVYLLQGEVVIVGDRNPLELAGDKYWVLYFAPQDQKDVKNLLVVVKDDGATPTLEVRPSILEEVYGIDFDASLLDFIAARQLSFDKLDQRVQEVLVKSQANARVGLDRIQSQQASYPDLSFDAIGSALQDVEDRAQSISDGIRDGQASETSFRQTFNSDDLKLALTQYNASFDALVLLSADVDAYHKALDDEQKLVTKAKLPADVADSLSKSLDGIRDVGMDPSFLAQLAPVRRSLDTQYARRDAQINDTSSSFFFRMYKVDAGKAFDAANAREVPPDALLSEKFKSDFSVCRISTKDLQTQWVPVKEAMASSATTAGQYAALPAQIQAAVSTTDSLYARLNTCVQGTPPTPTPAPSNPAADLLSKGGWIVLLAIVGFLAFRYYQKKKMEQEEQE